MYRRLIFIAVAVLACAAAVMLAGCGSGSSQKVLTLTQEPGPVQDMALDMNPNGGMGDQYFFEGPVLKEGKTFGVMIGTITTEYSQMQMWRSDSEVRLLTAVYDLADGQISVQGATYYTPNAKQGDFKSFTRPIVGGTGTYTYLNARGEVTTTYDKNTNTYTHVLTYSTD